jgi:hypothetical protein
VSRHRSRTVTVERVVAAPASRIFELLADPRQHPSIDGSGAVRDPRYTAPARLSQDAQFVMRMRVRPTTRHPADLLQVAVAIMCRGRLTNTVVNFAEGRCIAWRNFGRHVWRYDLEPLDDASTLVRETFDYSTNTFPPLLELVGFPAKNAAAMALSLERIGALLESTDSHAQS